MTKPIIAIDIDGVQLDYRAAYIRKWEQIFGYRPKLKDAHAYKLWDRFDIPFLTDPVEVEKLNREKDDEFWRTMPVLDGAVEAINILQQEGYKLIAVSAAAECQAVNRAHNLESHGIFLDDVICSHIPGAISPKTEIINKMMPVYFVDDYINYFHGISPEVKKVLINVPVNEPSKHVDMGEMYLVVDSLHAFAKWIEQNDSRFNWRDHLTDDDFYRHG